MFNLQQLRFFAVLAASLFTFHPFASAAQTSNQDQRAILHDNFRIAGTVTSASTHPLARARVVIVNTRNPQELQSLVTGEDGRFKFVVGAGKYSLQAAKRGFITGSYNQHEQFSTAIVTGAG